LAAPSHFSPSAATIGVVLEDHDGLQALFMAARSGIVDPVRQVGDSRHQAGLHVDDAGHADADAQQWRGILIFVRNVLDGVAHVADDGIASPGKPWSERDLFDQRALLVDAGDAQICCRRGPLRWRIDS